MPPRGFEPLTLAGHGPKPCAYTGFRHGGVRLQASEMYHFSAFYVNFTGVLVYLTYMRSLFQYKKTRLSLLIIVFGVVAPEFFALAEPRSVVITEIASSLPTDEEWIEVYNTTDGIVDISAWRFVEDFTENDPDGVRHKLTSYRADSLLDPREYAIIANNAALFLEKHQDFSGALFDSSWGSLKETGEKIEIIDGNGVVIEEFSYLQTDDGILARKDPFFSDYSSLNWVNVQGGGTPGKPYDAIILPLTPASQTSTPAEISPNSSSSEQVIFPVKPLEPPTAAAGINVAARVGETIIFDGSRSYDSSGGELLYHWDFGDGTKAEGAVVKHAFLLEGDYRALLTVSNSVGNDSDSARVTVVGDSSEPALLKNNEPLALTPEDTRTLPPKTEAVIQGIVTVEPGIFAKTYFYISSKDGTVASQVYSADGEFPDLHIGQVIEAAGTISSYYGVKRIITRAPGAISVIRGEDPLPGEEVALSLIDDAYLGRLITLKGAVLKEDGKIFITADDGGRIRVEVKNGTGISKTDLHEGVLVSLTGIIDKTVNGLRFLPRYPGDIVVVTPIDVDAPEGVSNKSRVLGEKAEIVLPEIEYTPSIETLEYTTDEQSRSGIVKYLVATAAALAFILAGVFVRERQEKQRISSS